MKRFGHTRAFRAMFKRTLPPFDRFIHRISGGRVNFGSSVVPTLMLIQRGRKTGREYRTPLAYLTVGDGFALAGSNWGQTMDPQWVKNLLANGDVRVVIHGEEIPVHARAVSGAERADLWQRFVAVWPAYETYEVRSGDREIRLFMLERR
jgi:deazaflavin-dependent oxidoreductase (nitroreductase family)